MSKKKDTATIDRKSGTLTIQCGNCTHTQVAEGERCGGGFNPVLGRDEEEYFIFGSDADFCNKCDRQLQWHKR